MELLPKGNARGSWRCEGLETRKPIFLMAPFLPFLRVHRPYSKPLGLTTPNSQRPPSATGGSCFLKSLPCISSVSAFAPQPPIPAEPTE